MALTKTFVFEDVWGKTRLRCYDVTLDNSYPTNGYTIAQGFSAAAMGFGPPPHTLLGLWVIAWDADGPGVILGLDVVNQKLMAFRSGTVTPAGTIGGNVTVVGGAIGEAIGINPDSNAGVLSKAAATNRTIPIATFLGAAPTFTGTATGQSALAQVSNGVDLSAFRPRIVFFGL